MEKLDVINNRERFEKLKEAIETMKSHKGPFLLEVVTSPDEPTIP